MANGKFAGGDGTEQNPYLIEDAFDLDAVRNGLDKCYKLIKDIDLDIEPFNQGEGWTPIGNSYLFKGCFNGDSHIIKNLYINRPDKSKIGLFKNNDGLISNLGILNINVLGKSEVGGLVGTKLDNGSIKNCFAKGKVQGKEMIGGVIGRSWGNGTIQILNCYSICDVIGINNYYIGGFVGYSHNATRLKNCYVIGQVQGSTKGEFVGGFVGRHDNDGAQIINSYWDIETSGQTISAGGEGKTTAEMQTISTFIDWDKEKLDNGTSIWILEEGQYPRLWFDIERKYLMQQNENYYSINNHYIDISKENDNKGVLINDYGYDDLSILTKKLDNKKIPTKVNNDYYESFDIELNDVKDNVSLVEEDNKKYIQYDCDTYRILDKIKANNNGKFDILMKEF